MREASMFAAIRRFSFRPDGTEELMRTVESDFAPSLTQIPGFVAYHLVDIGENSAISVSIFQSKDAAEQSSHLADELAGRLSHLGLTHFDVFTGEVGVQRLAPQATSPGYTK
jgi:hypothetical protein